MAYTTDIPAVGDGISSDISAMKGNFDFLHAWLLAGGLPVAEAGGSADAITATFSPAITGPNDLQIVAIRLAHANATTTPTFAPNSLAAWTITKNGGSPLVAGDLPGAGAWAFLAANASTTKWELLNPAFKSVMTAVDKSSSRTIGTVYHNDGTSIRFILVSIRNLTGHVQFVCDANSNPSTLMGDAAGNNYIPLFLPVPPGFYYKMYQATGSADFEYWWELD